MAIPLNNRRHPVMPTEEPRGFLRSLALGRNDGKEKRSVEMTEKKRRKDVFSPSPRATSSMFAKQIYLPKVPFRETAIAGPPKLSLTVIASF